MKMKSKREYYEYKEGVRVKIRWSYKTSYRKKGLIGLYGTITRGTDYNFCSRDVGVLIDGKMNPLSSKGVYWFTVTELEIIREESEEEIMTGFNRVAIVNLLDDYSKKDYAFALFESEWALIEQGANAVNPNNLVVVNPRGKDNRVLGVVKQILTTEEYPTSVTAQVVGVVNITGYIERAAEEDRLKEIAKKKASIERELKEEINKINNIELYEKMAKDHPENTRLSELVAELKELSM